MITMERIFKASDGFTSKNCIEVQTYQAKLNFKELCRQTHMNEKLLFGWLLKNKQIIDNLYRPHNMEINQCLEKNNQK